MPVCMGYGVRTMLQKYDSVALNGERTIEFVQGAGDVFHAAFAGHGDRKGRLGLVAESACVVTENES